MTTSKVTQTNLYPGVVSQAGQVKSGQADEFSKIFAAQSAETENKVQTNPETETKEADTVQNTSETKDEPTVDETSKAEQTEETKDVSEEVKTDDETQTQEENDVDADEMAEAISEIMATIQQVLGVTETELQSALQELGISPEDLLNTDKIPQLVVALTEGADELSVMTNEELFADVQEITAKVEELLQNFSGKVNQVPEATEDLLVNVPDTETVLETETVRNVAGDKVADVPGMEEVRVQNAIESTATLESTDDSRQGTDTGANQQMTFAQTVVEQLEQAVTKAETSYASTTTTESIMNQIQDVIRVIQSQDMTEMELQLHPASLGHVRVSLTASEGVITATFTTESEAVKAALETQMITLKQSFEEQGIKVEAVEVTVASHAFEHNLSGDESGAGEQSAPEKKKNARRISLTDLMNGIEEEALSDEDRIVAEMMKQNGNTVDYTV